jgi:isoamylase
MPKYRVVDPAYPGSVQPYEMHVHVHGYTKLHSGVSEELRGTFRGLTEPAVLDYLRSRGATAVELLPFHTFIDDSYLLDRSRADRCRAR